MQPLLAGGGRTREGGSRGSEVGGAVGGAREFSRHSSRYKGYPENACCQQKVNYFFGVRTASRGGRWVGVRNGKHYMALKCQEMIVLDDRKYVMT
jgi:hypothetical protein